METENRILVYNLTESSLFGLRNLYDPNALTLFHARSFEDIQKILKELPGMIDVMIFDIDHDKADRFQIIRQVRSINKNVPVLIISENNKRQAIMVALMEGVSDYILKPVDYQILKTKIQKYTNHGTLSEDIRISLNIPDYLNTEIKKASKGKYALSVMMCQLHYYKDQKLRQDEDYLLNDTVFRNLKEIFFETDLLIKYATNSFIGFFPFCEAQNIEIIRRKVMQNFEALRKGNVALADYHLHISFHTMPEDGHDGREIILSLAERISKDIETLGAMDW